ncbi:hypothetical protein M446_0955 [Methylobacterium sp. 4-46]|uniref:hypothetical protein n=1 Tax=unclassified Methylobacterium TaxID=2615210 RepID=UPI000152D3FB|nr:MULTISPECIES: hypothetical protein [Methylobacterium]ACA15504.1 hypothetical protein M446_0955 [Methylobacterium sp. 4-46]WFT81220.1 hypothetical protein QA634_04755 [Methylobacterium nodulans]
MTETPLPSHPRQDRAALLAAFYQYLGGRLDSVARRSSLLMAFLASFLGFAVSPLMRGGTTPILEKAAFAASHPSLWAGVAGMVVLLWSELARVRRSADLFSRIAFAEDDLAALQERFVASPIDTLFREAIANLRVVGGLLRRKIRLYNAGVALFVLSVTLSVIGL